jgi:hypothetical protein
MSNEERPKSVRRGGLFWPVVLIGLGIIFLLNNLGYLDWSIWRTLWRVWPVFLIAAGLDLLIGRRSIWGSVVALLLILGVFVAGIWLAWQPLGGQMIATETLTRELQGASQAEVKVERGVGAIQIGALEDGDNLVEGTLNRQRGEEAVIEYEVQEGTAYLGIRTRGQVVQPTWGRWEDWILRVNPDIPLELEVSSAAGQLDLDLRDLALDALQINMGVGQADVLMPDAGIVEARIDGAIGQLTLVIPTGMEARINFSTALVARDVPSSFAQDGAVYTSPGYEGAESRADIEIGLAIGAIDVDYH